MCQIFAGKSNEIRSLLLDTAGLIEDVYFNNRDGLGLMYAQNGALHTDKVLPKDEREARAFVTAMPIDGRQIAMHWRMKTHGDVDLENTHPYPVVPGIALIHNGILTQGNAADKTRSDTWHYARFMAQMLRDHPELVTNEAWLELVEADIGRQNRFVLLNGAGDMRILNKSTGYMTGDVWVANKYSFSSELIWPEDARRTFMDRPFGGNTLAEWASLCDYDSPDDTLCDDLTDEVMLAVDEDDQQELGFLLGRYTHDTVGALCLYAEDVHAHVETIAPILNTSELGFVRAIAASDIDDALHHLESIDEQRAAEVLMYCVHKYTIAEE